MIHMFKKFFSLVAFTSIASMYAGTQPVVSQYSIRSQNFDGARKVAGEADLTHICNADSYYGLFSVTPAYYRSFRPNRISECLFGNDLIDPNTNNNNGETLLIQGSLVSNRNARAWLADYFYLSQDFSSRVEFQPLIQNFVLDFNLFVGLNDWVNGLYFRIYFPFVHTRWHLRMQETVTTPGTGVAAGFLTSGDFPAANLSRNFTAFVNGGVVTPPAEALIDPNGNTFPITLQPLRFAKMSQTVLTKNRIPDIRMELGYDFLLGDNYHLGFNIQGAVPTGNRPDGEFLFEPLVGTRHGELGGGVNGHYVFWCSENEERHLGFYVDANVLHLFKSRETRSFDLRGKPNSRYMLAERLGTPIVGNLQGGGITPVAQFNGQFAPLANLTASEVNVSVNVQGDVSAWFNYTHCGFSWDLGYNFWGRGCEKIKFRNDHPTNLPNDTTWALKGDAQVFGFNTTVPPFSQAVALSATESQATINTGTNLPTNTVNGNIDFPQLATSGDAPLVNPINVQINTSIQPVFIRAQDINLDQTSRGISHSVWTHFAYIWEGECIRPFLGIGGKAEFGQHEKSRTTTTTTTTTSNNDSSCIDCAVSQWAIWLKTGVAWE